VQAREAAIGERGILPGSDLAFIFFEPARQRPRLALRRQQLFARGRPAAFDLLFWNSDSANLPGPMYCYYVRNTYLENRLKQPGALVNCGVPVDLGKSEIAGVCAVDARGPTSSHGGLPIARFRCWVEKRRFALGASGHIAGIVNPRPRSAAVTGSGSPIRTIRCVAGRCARGARQLVAVLERVARSPCRRHAPGTERARQRAIQADRACTAVAM